jgi:hypothetical protein
MLILRREPPRHPKRVPPLLRKEGSFVKLFIDAKMVMDEELGAMRVSEDAKACRHFSPTVPKEERTGIILPTKLFDG